MNIEEAKLKLYNIAYRDLQTKPYDLKLADVIQILNQIKLDKPKTEVQQCVAEWYEENKDKFYLNLHKLAWELIENLDEDCFVPVTALNSDFKRWYFRNKTAMKTLINMHQFGYEVEQEKLYKVKIHGAHLFKMKSENQVRFKLVSNLMDLPDNEYDCTDKLTEQEIKQADERLWQFAKVVTE
ncbi:TPA: DUF1642 domain-containing protein [Streptococcus agalactiae]|nr:DUF1642 domain-containing protein [Streptococcus agalactiae]